MKTNLIFILLLLCAVQAYPSDTYLANIYGRETRSLNGKWDAIVDLYEQGATSKIFLNKKATGHSDFYEYSFENGLRLNVPGDWNSQKQELKYYEGTVWYARHFNSEKETGKRKFLYFCGVSYRCNIYLNGRKIGNHEGSFTPFQIEVTDDLLQGDNCLIVEVNNRRQKDAIPALAFDWWNYGGITRDVMLVTVPDLYISDYFVQLDKVSPNIIRARISLSGNQKGEVVQLKIPELGKTLRMTTDSMGIAQGVIHTKLTRWSPENPKLYDVEITTTSDRITEKIGFRNIKAEGTKIYLNDKPLFLRSISFHEEIPQRMGRACTASDAEQLLSEARALGVNMVRLAHYQQNEYIVRRAEEMGIMLWQEIPVWQSIDFTSPETLEKAKKMLRETILRDKNRCADCFWGIANETRPSEARNAFLSELLKTGKELDTTRLFVGAFDNVYFNSESKLFEMEDPFIDKLDMIGINKYMGWYAPWPLEPEKCNWKVALNKPLFISEFGCEALYGQSGDATVASSWSEEYQEKLFRDNLKMFRNIPNLCGISPWVLYDFRSPTRFHPTNQEGWNRKGLVSDQGQRKKAWYVIHEFYEQIRKKDIVNLK